jgi:hypothetical protein
MCTIHSKSHLYYRRVCLYFRLKDEALLEERAMISVRTQTKLGVVAAGVTLALTVVTFWGCGANAKAANGAPNPTAPVTPVGDQGPSGQVLPKLEGVAAPPWVKVGLRLTYYVRTATIAGTGADWKEDPDGGWKSDDGRRWSPTEKGPGAAEGFLQCDVTALPSGAAVIYASFYLVGKPGDTPTLAFSYPIIGQAANAGGFWVNPDELKKAKNTVTKDLKVLRMPYKIGDQSRPAVWIQTFNERSNLMYVYDEETGVLLHDGSAVEGKASPVVGKNEVSNTPSTTISHGTLVSQRMVAYPWAGEDATSWSNSPESLRYTGTTVVPTGGGRTLQLGQELIAKPQGNGTGWVRYSMVLNTTNSMGMPPQSAPSETVNGLGQFGCVWIPPASLAKLTRGQKLDNDPVTLTQVTVTEVSKKRVVISAVSPSQTLRWGYDLTTGIMNLIVKEDHNILAPIKTSMSLRN